MRKILFILVIVLISTGLWAQDDEPPDTAGIDAEAQEDYFVRVLPESVFIRALPDSEAEVVGGAFENDILLAVGRNIDGAWLEVRRPGRELNSGWIAREWLVISFDIAVLPITDLETGLIGPEPVFDSGLSVFILTESALRSRPSQNGEQVAIVPIQLTIPAFERSPDNLWVRVNYLGTTGWIAEFLVRPSGEIASLPISDAFTFNTVAVEIIPVEVQLAQVERLREYMIPKRDLIDSVANFWDVVRTGEVVPCNPPGGGFGYYPYSDQDVKELPEMRRYIRRLNWAIDDMNSSIAMMQRCGVYSESQLSSAYAQAINSRLLFNVMLRELDVLVETVILRNP